MTNLLRVRIISRPFAGGRERGKSVDVARRVRDRKRLAALGMTGEWAVPAPE
jgi:hypothetical protein